MIVGDRAPSEQSLAFGQPLARSPDRPWPVRGRRDHGPMDAMPVSRPIARARDSSASARRPCAAPRRESAAPPPRMRAAQGTREVESLPHGTRQPDRLRPMRRAANMSAFRLASAPRAVRHPRGGLGGGLRDRERIDCVEVQPAYASMQAFATSMRPKPCSRQSATQARSARCASACVRATYSASPEPTERRRLELGRAARVRRAQALLCSSRKP